MKIVRDDDEALVLKNGSLLGPFVFAPIMFVVVIFLGAFIHTLTHVSAALIFAMLLVGGFVVLFTQISTSNTFVFARQSRRFMVMRKYLARQTREEYEFDEVNFVQLKPGPHRTETLQIVLNSGKKKVVVECYARSRLKQMRADTVLLCETLEQPEPQFRKTLGEHVQSLYQKLTG
jgi:hypothetical protein